MRATLRLFYMILIAAMPLAGHASGLDHWGVWDAPSSFFPGKYFEQKAQFYLKKKDYSFALQMFELSGYWADKVSQYNTGIMYYNGIGVPADRTRGVAWLGIAAESHEDLADRALQIAYASLSDTEKQQSDLLFRQLDEKYGDKVTLPRALAQYALDKGNSVFGFGGGAGTVYGCAGAAGCSEENSVDFVRSVDRQRDDLISKITGHVSVGAVQPLDVANAAKAGASTTPIDVPDTVNKPKTPQPH